MTDDRKDHAHPSRLTGDARRYACWDSPSEAEPTLAMCHYAQRDTAAGCRGCVHRDPAMSASNAEILNWRACRLKLVKIRWRGPGQDWPYFVVLRVHGPLRAVLLRGMDYPDGSAKHEGDEFWADMDDVADFSVHKWA